MCIYGWLGRSFVTILGLVFRCEYFGIYLIDHTTCLTGYMHSCYIVHEYNATIMWNTTSTATQSLPHPSPSATAIFADSDRQIQ